MVVPMAFYLTLEMDLPLELAPSWSWINEKFELELDLLAKNVKKA